MAVFSLSWHKHACLKSLNQLLTNCIMNHYAVLQSVSILKAFRSFGQYIVYPLRNHVKIVTIYPTQSRL